jgi:hypothetical protein
MLSFINELRRRNVIRVAAFYAAAGWLLVQVATQVFAFTPALLRLDPDWDNLRSDPRFQKLPSSQQ